jgi:hypothetical protein
MSEPPEPAMRARNPDRRLEAASGRECDRVYERFARLASGHDSMTAAPARCHFPLPLEPAEQPQQPVKDRKRVWRTSGDEQINGQ